MEKQQERGFSLIEVLITLVVVSVGVLALGNFTVSIMANGQLSRERLTAVHLAEQVLEHWQHHAADYAPVITASTCALSDAGGTPSYPVTTACTPSSGVGISYTIMVNETQAAGPLSPPTGSLTTLATFTQQGYANMPKTKLVTVSWTHKGTSHSIYLTHLSQAKL